MRDSGFEDISAWLAHIGMSEFDRAFSQNGVDFDLLPELTGEDLREIGMTRLADRKRVLKEIHLLSVQKARSSIERRLLSVFFCDMVGSTARSTQVDAEELRSEMKSYQDAVVAAVNSHGGFVARFTGDGVMAYFGWPYADEDQASQAVRAGLDAIHRVGQLQFEDGFSAQCRVGIATGRVVVGGQQDPDSAFGETPNLAARLQSLADIDRIVIDSVTQRAIGYRFVTSYMQSAQLKGFDQPIAAWRVMNERRYVDRFESRGGGGSVFVGRDKELATLQRSWAQARSGEGRVVLLRGDPGIGKSRMVKEFYKFLLQDTANIEQYHCSPHHTNSAFYPIISHYEQAIGIDSADDSDEEKFNKLKEAIDPVISEDDTSVNLIAQLFSIDGMRDGGVAELTPQERRQQTIDIMVARTLLRASRAPLVYVVEDAHWIDPSTLLLLESIMEKIEHVPILILITCRPTNYPTFTPSQLFDEQALPRLDEGSIQQLAQSVDSSGRLTAPEVRHIVRRADGIPLYAEEITRAVIEQSRGADGIELPESIEASLIARLDNLGAARALIQTASVVGRVFRLSQLYALADEAEAALLPDIGTAIAAGLLEEVPCKGDRAFRFTHALVQDVAYNGLLKQQRRQLHNRMASRVLGDTVRLREPELVAYHLTRAGETESAIQYWKRAGSRGVAASANAEAISHFQQGLRLISRLPENDERHELEFALLVAMAAALIVEKGYTSDELKTCIDDALAITKQIDFTPDLYSLLYSQWGFQLTVGLMEESRNTAYKFSELAERQGDDVALYARYRMLGASHMCLGELEQARSELGKLVDDYHPARHAELKNVYGVDLCVAGRCFSSEVLWLLGHVEEAKASAALALAQARDINHLQSHAISLHFCGLIAFLNRDRAAIGEYIGEMMELTKEHVIGAWPTLGGAMLGWAMLEEGDPEDSLAALKNGVTDASRLGVSMFIPFFHCRIAEVLLTMGRLNEAEQYLQDADTLIQRTGETVFKGEILQLMAQLHLRHKPDTAGAEEYFLEGLAHARSQRARSVELRVATAYAAYLVEKGDIADAASVIKPVIQQFPASVTSADLQDARELLERIEPSPGSREQKFLQPDCAGPAA